MSDIQGIPGASNAPLSNIRSTGEVDDHGVNLNKHKRRQSLVRSKSEDDLFFKRYLGAWRISSLPSKDDASIDEKFDSLENLLGQISNFSISNENKKYISKNVSKMVQAKAEVNPNILDSANKQPSLNSIQQKDMNWCKNANISKIATEMLRLAKLGFDLKSLGDCSLRQQATIVGYVAQMIDCGYDTEYSKAIFDSMVALYTVKDSDGNVHTIEEFLPESIDTEDYKVRVGLAMRSSLTAGKYYKKFRNFVVNPLSKVMKDRGGDYSIISDYLKEQVKGSWGDIALAFKGFYLEQRANPEEDKYYYLPTKFYKGVREDLQKKGNLEKDLKSSGPRLYVENFHKYLQVKYPQDMQKAYSEYFNSISVYQAFVAIAMNYIDGIVGLDKNKGMLSVYRGAGRKYIPGQPQGILDSTYLKGGLPFCKGNTRIQLDVPLCDVKALFFLSEEMCKSPQTSEEFEVICDLTHAKIKDETKVDMEKLPDISVIDMNKNGDVTLKLSNVLSMKSKFGTQKTYLAELTRSSLIEVDGKKMVHLYDKYHFWDDHIAVKVGDREFKGYTDDARIVEIAEKISNREIVFAEIADIDEDGKIVVNANGTKAYLDPDGPLLEIGSGKKLVRLHGYDDGFWKNHNGVKVGEKKYEGYTDNSVLVNFVEKANKGVAGCLKIIDVKDGEVELSINGHRALLKKPYITESDDDDELVQIHGANEEDIYWKEHILPEGVEAEGYKGYTDNPDILEIAEQAASGELSQGDIGKFLLLV